MSTHFSLFVALCDERNTYPSLFLYISYRSILLPLYFSFAPYLFEVKSSSPKHYVEDLTMNSLSPTKVYTTYHFQYSFPSHLFPFYCFVTRTLVSFSLSTFPSYFPLSLATFSPFLFHRHNRQRPPGLPKLCVIRENVIISDNPTLTITAHPKLYLS